MSGTPMKLILTQEVTGLGTPGDVVEVAGGYGRNYLVPRGLAMRWTRGAEKQIELIKRARSAREIRGLDDARAAAGRLRRPQGGPQARARGGRRQAVRLRVALRHRGGGQGRGRPRAGPPPDRDQEPDQDRRRAPGDGQAAPRGDRHDGRRGRRRLGPGPYAR